MTKEIIEEHERKRHLTEILIYPDHKERTESAEFRRTKKRLKKDGHYRCYICGSTENLQVHHYACEWALENSVDFKKMKAFCEEWDPYGYGRLLKNVPITDVDDIRNALVLCQEHHTGGMTDGVANGIHNITFPAWIIQKLALDGEEPVPDDTEELNAILKEE
jgi:hypothetical protein